MADKKPQTKKYPTIITQDLTTVREAKLVENRKKFENAFKTKTSSKGNPKKKKKRLTPEEKKERNKLLVEGIRRRQGMYEHYTKMFTRKYNQFFDEVMKHIKRVEQQRKDVKKHNEDIEKLENDKTKLKKQFKKSGKTFEEFKKQKKNAFKKLKDRFLKLKARGEQLEKERDILDKNYDLISLMKKELGTLSLDEYVDKKVKKAMELYDKHFHETRELERREGFEL
jgi:chaperonin cofactor prefoldin